MKKKRFYLLLTLFILTVSVQAQKGRHGVGITGGFYSQASESDKTGTGVEGSASIGLKYQYGISDIFEIEPSATIYFAEDPHSWYYQNVGVSYDFGRNLRQTKDCKIKYSFGISVHAYLTKTRCRPYVTAGCFIHSFDWAEFEYEDPIKDIKETIGGGSGSKIAGRGGLGLDYRLFYHSNLELEVCYDTYNSAFAGSLSYIYKF